MWLFHRRLRVDDTHCHMRLLEAWCHSGRSVHSGHDWITALQWTRPKLFLPYSAIDYQLRRGSECDLPNPTKAEVSPETGSGRARIVRENVGMQTENRSTVPATLIIPADLWRGIAGNVTSTICDRERLADN